MWEPPKGNWWSSCRLGASCLTTSVWCSSIVIHATLNHRMKMKQGRKFKYIGRTILNQICANEKNIYVNSVLDGGWLIKATPTPRHSPPYPTPTPTHQGSCPRYTWLRAVCVGRDFALDGVQKGFFIFSVKQTAVLFVLQPLPYSLYR